jgi:hypothetical protein
MNTRRLVTLITFLAVFAMAARYSVDTDTWWHLRTGAWIVEHRAILTSDPFSYTRYGESWRYPGWLVETLMYLSHQAFGPGGLNLWTALMVTLAFLFVWQTLDGGVFLKAFVTILAAAASAVYWAARPYLVTFVLAAAFLWILEDFRWGRSPRAQKRLWWLPLLMLIWVNSHGGFVVGFLLWGVYIFAMAVNWLVTLFVTQQHSSLIPKSQILILLLVGLLLLLAACINPAGPAILIYPFKTVSIGALQDFIQEWQSPDFHTPAAQPFIWLLLLTFGAVGVSRKRLALTDFLLAAGFAYMALLAWRNVALFALVAPPVLARHAAPVLAALGRRFGFRGVSDAPPTRMQGLLNWALLAVLLLAVVIKASLNFPASANRAEFRKTVPVDAVEFIKRQHPPGRLFNSYNWGGYLLWETPAYPVFIDGRTDLYDDEVTGEWLRVVRAETGWQEVLDRWNVRTILLEPGMPVVGHLQGAGWQLLYQDEMAVVYGR